VARRTLQTRFPETQSLATFENASAAYNSTRVIKMLAPIAFFKSTPPWFIGLPSEEGDVGIKRQKCATYVLK